jgi:hypothetical protein
VPPEYPFRLRESFLSPAETTFYHALREVLRDQLVAELLTIAPKVSLLDMVSVTRPNENVQHFNRLVRKSVDFLLIHRPTLHPSLAIEPEYPKQARHRTDHFMDHCSRLLTSFWVWCWKNTTTAVGQKGASPSPGQAQRIEGQYSPVCPRCGISMVLRFYRSGPNLGKRYYGCLNYPECTQIVPVD